MAGDEVIEPEIEVGGGGKKAMIIGLVALLLGAGGGVGAMKFMGDEPTPSAENAEGAGEGLADSLVNESTTDVVELGKFTVNLRDSAGGRLLQMEISVEASLEGVELVQKREAQVRDAILMLTSDYTYVELEGMDGKMRLRDEIQRRIDAVIEPKRIARVYFTNFVVQ